MGELLPLPSAGTNLEDASYTKCDPSQETSLPQASERTTEYGELDMVHTCDPSTLGG